MKLSIKFAHKTARNLILLLLALSTFLTSVVLNPKLGSQIAFNQTIQIIESASASTIGDTLTNYINSGKYNTVIGNGQCVTLTQNFLAFLGINPVDTYWPAPITAGGFTEEAVAGQGYQSDVSRFATYLFSQGRDEIVNHSGSINGVNYTSAFISNVNDLQRGDIVATTYMSNYSVSHTGIATGAPDATNFQLFDQNWSGGDTGTNAGYDNLNRSLFYGAIRIRFANEGQVINIRKVLGDFNGDGKTDLLRQEKNFNTGPYGQLTTSIMYSDGNSFQGNLVGVGDAQVFAQTFGSGVRIIPGDFNGDGKTDLVRQEGTADGSRDVEIYYANGNGFNNPVTIRWSNESTFNFAGGTNLIPGDFNGDGKTDLLRQEKNFNTGPYGQLTTSIMYSDGNSFQGNLVGVGDAQVFAQTFGSGVRIIPGDFNGDGKTDLVRQEGTADGSRDVEIYYANGNGFNNPVTIRWSNESTFNFAGGTNLIPGDFNGDGKTDLLRQEKNFNTGPYGQLTTSIMYSDGNSFQGNLVGVGDAQVFAQTFGSGVRIIPGDFNGDGKTDLVRQEGTADGSRDVEIYYANGNGFNNPVTIRWSNESTFNFAGGTNLITQ